GCGMLAGFDSDRWRYSAVICCSGCCSGAPVQVDFYVAAREQCARQAAGDGSSVAFSDGSGAGDGECSAVVLIQYIQVQISAEGEACCGRQQVQHFSGLYYAICIDVDLQGACVAAGGD